MSWMESPSSQPAGSLPLAPSHGAAVPPDSGPGVRPAAWFHRLSEGAANSLVLLALSPFVALTTGWMPRLLLALIVLDIPLQFQNHFFFREEDAARGALGGLNVSMTTIALAGLYTAWFLRAMASRDRGPRPPLHVNVALTIYLAISALSLVFAPDVSLAFFEVFLLLQLYLVYFYVANFVRTRQDVAIVSSMLLVGCILAGLGIIHMKAAGGLPPIILGRPWGLPSRVQFFEAASGVLRIGGTIGSPNNAGGYFAFVLAVAASLLFTRLPPARKWLAIATLGVGGLALLFTFSRGGWAAFALTLTLILAGFAWRMRLFSWKAPVAAFAVLLLLYLPFHNIVSERLFGDDRGAAFSRVPLMKLAFNIIGDNPVLGVGSNNFIMVMDRYVTSEFRSAFLFSVHNKYLLVWAETGFLGLIAYLVFLFGALRKGWQCWQLPDTALATLGLALTAGLVGHMLHMTVEVFNGRPLAQLVFLTAGLLTAMHRIGTTTPAEAQPSPA